MFMVVVLAFAVGGMLGLFFRPLSIIAASILMISAMAVSGQGISTSPLWTVILVIVLLNIGYLCGTMISWKFSSTSKLSNR